MVFTRDAVQRLLPFQGTTANSWTRENVTGNNFLGNGGTEINRTTQLYDLEYRHFDPLLGRMNGVDPMATKYASLTPYNYANNDPVYFNDPLGDDLYVPTWLYNLAMQGMRTAGMAPRNVMDGGGGGVFGGGGGMGSWADSYGGGAAWSPGGGWTPLTNGQALEAGINYNNQHNSWGSQFASTMSASPQYGAGTFMFDYNGGTYGGNYHTENGKVVSVALSSLAQAGNGGWYSTSQTEVTVFGEAQAIESGWNQFWSGFAGSQNSTDFSSATTVTSTALFWVDGVGSSVKYSARTFGELRNVVRAEKFFKPLGVVGGIVTTSMTAYDAAQDGNISNGDWFKIGAGVLQVGLAFTPVGWGVLAYNGVDLLVGITTGTSVTDRIANGIDKIGK